MKTLLIKILSCLVITSYVFGLSNYVTVQFTHYLHHKVSHTLDLHHDHSSGLLDNHTHSHNSFIDYALFIEGSKTEKESEKEAVPVVVSDYFSHLISCCLLISIIPHDDKLNNYESHIDINSKYIKPPTPPPRA